MPKILIIDDEPLTVEMLETFLKIQRYETVGAFSGTQGLEAIKKHRPDLIVLDLMMPDIEGFEVCQRLRTDPEYEDLAMTPVIAFSARSDPDARRRILDIGADAFYVKPLRLPEFLNEVRRLLAVKGAAGR
jgi:DNA-binding response OmpR family regulator